MIIVISRLTCSFSFHLWFVFYTWCYTAITHTDNKDINCDCHLDIYLLPSITNVLLFVNLSHKPLFSPEQVTRLAHWLSSPEAALSLMHVTHRSSPLLSLQSIGSIQNYFLQLCSSGDIYWLFSASLQPPAQPSTQGEDRPATTESLNSWDWCDYSMSSIDLTQRRWSYSLHQGEYNSLISKYTIYHIIER